MLPAEGVDDTTRRRRATIAPLVRSGFTYAVYFGTAVLILASLGFNPMPFLAGAGILGLVIGFGAQSLINDVVSGFFILFENTYLVGDVIEAGGGKGVVEAIEFRTTKIRDGDGRVHIIRNGNVKDVINYSKEYTLAVVPVDIAYGADLPWVFAMLREAGARVRAENPDVLDDTQIDGITGFGATTMTVRTSTRVKPGRHEAAAAALRFSIKEACDRRAAGPHGAPRAGAGRGRARPGVTRDTREPFLFGVGGASAPPRGGSEEPPYVEHVPAVASRSPATLWPTLECRAMKAEEPNGGSARVLERRSVEAGHPRLRHPGDDRRRPRLRSAGRAHRRLRQRRHPVVREADADRARLHPAAARRHGRGRRRCASASPGRPRAIRTTPGWARSSPSTITATTAT